MYEAQNTTEINPSTKYQVNRFFSATTELEKWVLSNGVWIHAGYFSVPGRVTAESYVKSLRG